MEISIVILVYNEKENLRGLYCSLKETLRNINKEHELIFIDDGSCDGSLTELKNISLKDSTVRFVKLDKKYGMATGLCVGFRKARGEIIVTIDADMQNDPRDIISLLQNMNGLDLLCGVRRERKDGLAKAISSRIANFLRNLILNENFQDVGCGLKAIRKECLDKITLYKNFEVFLPSLFLINGFKVGELTITHKKRSYGKSKFNIKNRLVKYFFSLLMVWWMKKNKITYKILEEI